MSQERLVRAIKRDGVLDGRRLETVREVCRLTFGGKAYPVVATVERLTGIPEPRLYRHLVVLRPDLSKAYVLAYDLGVEPAACDRNRVHFSGGSVFVGQEQGATVQFAHGAADAWIVSAGARPSTPSSRQAPSDTFRTPLRQDPGPTSPRAPFRPT